MISDPAFNRLDTSIFRERGHISPFEKKSDNWQKTKKICLTDQQIRKDSLEWKGSFQHSMKGTKNTCGMSENTVLKRYGRTNRDANAIFWKSKWLDKTLKSEKII